MKDNLDIYLSGQKLYGDDFSPQEAREWFDDERDGYFDLKDRQRYPYEYHAFNIFHGYRFLGDRVFKNVLGIGSAFGDEFIPIADRIEKLTILESGEGFFNDRIKNLTPTYISADFSGSLPFVDNSFDLINCLESLHHMPNVSRTLNEVHRCLKKGGYVLISEPIVSQGDWRMKRKGLTKRERGIPLAIFDKILADAGFKVVQRRECAFPLTRRMSRFLKTSGFNSKFFVVLDYLLSKLFSFNDVYHPRHFWQKLRPMVVFYLAEK